MALTRLRARGVTATETLTVNDIAVTNSASVTGNLSFGSRDYKTGEVLEVIEGACDGRTIVAPSGSYTLQNVTAAQNFTTTRAAMTGSSLSYTPPAGTNYVRYSFRFHFDAEGLSGISHHSVFLDGTEIIPSYRCIASAYSTTVQYNQQVQVEYIVDCTAEADDIANGKLAGWTTAKTIEVRSREFSTSYLFRAHLNTWRDGSGATGAFVLAVPYLSIVAIK